MWTFIIVIVVCIIGKFLFDTAKQSSDIKDQGGIRQKYSILINHFLQGHERCRILQSSNTFVAVGVQGPAGSQIYYVYPTYGNVTIRMEMKNNPLWGNMKMEWTFPENMDQNRMIEKINIDIENKITSITTYL